MKRLLITCTVTMLAEVIAGGTIAQTAMPANPILTSGNSNSGALTAGTTTLTEAEVKLRLESTGFSKVTSLAKNPDGIWRGKATRGGTIFAVAVDPRGNVAITD